MNRASPVPAARAVDRLLMAGKPVERCSCDHALALQRRIDAAGTLLSAWFVLLSDDSKNVAARVKILAALVALEWEG